MLQCWTEDCISIYQDIGLSLNKGDYNTEEKWLNALEAMEKNFIIYVPKGEAMKNLFFICQKPGETQKNYFTRFIKYRKAAKLYNMALPTHKNQIAAWSWCWTHSTWGTGPRREKHT